MDEKINGRTPEEIKRWVDGRATCNTCPKEHEVGCEYGERTEDCQMCIDTIAYIERLESERDAALAKVPRWISVEERLPRCGERVLVTNDGSVWEAYLSISHKWVRQEFVWAAKVTHWMPLPSEPKEGE